MAIAQSTSRPTLLVALREDLRSEPGRLQAALRLGLAAVLVVGLEMTLWYGLMYPGMTTLLILTEARGLSTLTRILLSLFGTVVGCAFAVVLAALFIQQPWFLLLIMFCYIVVVMYWMGSSRYRGAWFAAGYAFVITIYMSFFSKQSAEPIATMVFRSMATGIGCGGFVMIFLWPDRPWNALRRRLIEGLERSRGRLRALRMACTAGTALQPDDGDDSSQTPALNQLALCAETDLDLDPRQAAALGALVAFEGSVALATSIALEAARSGRTAEIASDAQLLTECEDGIDMVLAVLRQPPPSSTFQVTDEDTGSVQPVAPSPLEALRATSSSAPRAARAATAFGSLPTNRNFLVQLWLELNHCAPRLFRMPAWPPDRLQLQHAVKCSASIMVCALFCITMNWATGIGCVETIMLVVQATFGGTLLIGGLRLVGVVLGYVIAVLLVIFYIPTIETIPGFLLIFAVLGSAAGWALHGSPRVAVPALQTLIVVDFSILQVPRPSISLDPVMDFTLAVGMGVLVTFVIYRLLWPVHAAHELRVAVANTLRATAALLRASAAAPVTAAQLDNARLGIADGTARAMSFHANAQLEADVPPERGAIEIAIVTEADELCNGVVGALERGRLVGTAGPEVADRLSLAAARIDDAATRISPAAAATAAPAPEAVRAPAPVRTAWEHRLENDVARSDSLARRAHDLDSAPAGRPMLLGLS